MDDGIRRRIERATGVAGLSELLADRLSAGDLQSLLLEVYARRHPLNSGRGVELLRRYRESRFCPPSPCHPRRLANLHLLALDCLAPEFEALELSPLAPLGACSAVASVHQNKVVSTVRAAEVSSDPSNLLALECALRRQETRPVHLWASQRVVRAQALPKASGFYAHFQLLALASANRWSPEFEKSALTAHLVYHLTLLQRSLPEAQLSVKLTELAKKPARPVRDELAPQFPAVRWEWAPERTAGRGYYQKCCFKVYANDCELGDGGFTNWTAQLLSDARECLLTSGLGLERLAQLASTG